MKNWLIVFAVIVGSLHANAEGGDARSEARLKVVLARRSAANAYSESLYAFAKDDMEENKLQLAISAVWVKKMTEQKRVVADLESKGYEKTEDSITFDKLIDQWESLVEGVEARNAKLRDLMTKGLSPEHAIVDLGKYNETCSKESKKIVEKIKSLSLPGAADVFDAAKIEAEWTLQEKAERTRLDRVQRAEALARKRAEEEREREAKAAEKERERKAQLARKAEEETDSNGLVFMRKSLKFEGGAFGGEITGVVENRRGKKLRYVEIRFNVYDESGAQVGTALANVTDLEAGGKWKFRAIVLEAQATKCKLTELSGF